MAQTHQNQEFQLMEGGLSSEQSNPSHEHLSPSHEHSAPSQGLKLWAISELADRYSTSTRTVQKMVGFVVEAYSWLNLEQLKQGASAQTRYTSLCVDYLDDLQRAKEQGMSSPDWVQRVKENDAPDDVLEGELEPEPPSPSQSPGGSLITYDSRQQATSIININLKNLNVGLQSVDTQALEAQTDHAKQVTANAAGILKDAISAKFQADIKQVVAQNENLAAGIQAGAIVDAVQNLGLGKSDRPSESPSQSS